jgi:transcriptional regulator with XRE-family HTH domain
MRKHQAILQSLLRKLRKEAGLNQQELANALHKPQSFVSKVESGERRLDILELRLICQQFGLDLVSFAERLEKELSADDEGTTGVSQSE